MDVKEFMKSYFEILSCFAKNSEQKDIYGITKGEIGIMIYISKHNNFTNPGELIERFGVCSGRIGNALKNLENKGMIKRNSNDKDKRKTNVFLTEKGLEISKMMIEDINKKMLEFYNRLGENDAKELIRILKKINNEKEEKNV